jgi:hypothetical protein
VTRSIAEQTLAVQLEQAGIPFEREFAFAPPRKWRADFAIVGRFDMKLGANLIWGMTAKLLIEIDGGGYVQGRHSRGAGMEKDAEKASAAAILGYRVLRMTPAQVEDGRGLAWVKAALGVGER